MSTPGGTNGPTWRIGELERRVTRLENLEPAVVANEVAGMKHDIHQLSEDLAAIRKILIGFLVTFAFSSITIVLTVVALTVGR